MHLIGSVRTRKFNMQSLQIGSVLKSLKSTGKKEEEKTNLYKLDW